MRASLWAIIALSTLVPAPAAAQNGRVLWRFEIPSNNSGKFIGVAADGRVYTTSFNPARLYALTPGGSLIWSLDIGVASGMWPISFAADGTIYTGAVGVRAVNPDGTLRWAFDPGSWILAGPTVGPDGNIYAADEVLRGGLGFFSLDRDGHLRWSNPGDPVVAGLYDPGLDEIVFGAGRLFSGIHFTRSGPWISSYAFDLDGHQLWFRQIVGLAGGPSSNPRLFPDGRLIFRWGQGSLAALRQDGTDDWVEPHPDGAQTLVTPAVGPDGAVYAGDVYGVQLWSANPDGTTRWVKDVGTDEYLAAEGLGVSPDNRVLVAGGWTISASDGLTHGWIRGYDPANGEQLWQVDLEREQGQTQLTRTVRPDFSSDGDTAYLTTWFTGDGVGHSYLYAIALGDPTDVPGGVQTAPHVTILHGNSPNPFNPATTIRFDLASPGHVSLRIYTIDGRLVRTLVDERLAHRHHEIRWDGADDSGRTVPTGLYMCRLTSEGGSATRKMMALK